MNILTELLTAQNDEALDPHARQNLALAVNALAERSWRERIGAAASGGYDFSDTMHNVYLDYGYPQTLEFAQFWNMYRRFGIARAVVDTPVEIGWLSAPTVGAPAATLQDLERLDQRIKLWQRLKGVDVRQRVGRYAGLFMRVRDNEDPKNPIRGKLGGEGALVSATPLYEGQLQVESVENDPRSEAYGQPTMYRYRASSTGGRNTETAATFLIHPDRVVIAAEGADDGGIYGIPALESIYNSLMDLRKIIGGGAEGFYKNAAQSVVFGVSDAKAFTGAKALLSKFEDNYDDWSHNRMRRGLVAPGMNPSPLNSTLVSSDPHFDAAMSDIAAGSHIPATILIGRQTGVLASKEDSRLFLTRANSRRENYQTELVLSVLEWMQRWGILAAGSIGLEWEDLLTLSDAERLANAGLMADINQKQYLAGGEIAFSGVQIQQAAGYEPEAAHDLLEA